MTTDPAPVQTPPAKPRRPTVLDLLPEGIPDPGPLITQDEAIDRMRRLGVEADADDLRYWVYAGVLPRPVRRWHEGATRALWPTAIVRAVEELRALQRRGITLDQIAPQVRRRLVAEMVKRSSAPYGDKVDAVLALDRPLADLALPPFVVDALAELADSRAGLTGVPTRDVKIAITGTDGRRTEYTMTPAADGSWTVR
jgi:hypothetical protein